MTYTEAPEHNGIFTTETAQITVAKDRFDKASWYAFIPSTHRQRRRNETFVSSASAM